MVEEIEAEARADREARGVEPLDVDAILRQDPHLRPNQTKKSPAPACHAASKAFRKRFWEEYSAFVADFREAAEKLRAGEWPASRTCGEKRVAPIRQHLSGQHLSGRRKNKS